MQKEGREPNCGRNHSSGALIPERSHFRCAPTSGRSRFLSPAPLAAAVNGIGGEGGMGGRGQAERPRPFRL